MFCPLFAPFLKKGERCNYCDLLATTISKGRGDDVASSHRSAWVTGTIKHQYAGNQKRTCTPTFQINN